MDALLKEGHIHMVDADLKSYFDPIPHERLMTLLKERVADGRLLALVESCLGAGVMEERRGWPATERGTPQGGVISPMLANVFAPLDGFVRRRLSSLLAKRRGRTVHGTGAAHQEWPTDWRAGCGKSARPVRREEQGSIPCSYPIH